MMNQQINPKDEATRRVKAALTLLPGTLTAAYSVALLQSPELVEAESDPSWFLQSEKDFQKAAFKLSMYWSKRYIYYGARAYLPLNQTGHGALSPEDLAALPTSCLQALPPDSQGRAVYWISSARAMNFQTESDIRCLFYQLQLAKGGFSAAQGIVVLLLVGDHINFDRLSTLLCLISELLATVMPFCIRHLHILSRNPGENVSLTISGVVKLAMDKSLSQECSIGTAASNLPQEMLGKLVPFGLSPQGLPHELGGTYVPMMHAAAVAIEAVAQLGMDLGQARSPCVPELAAIQNRAPFANQPQWGQSNVSDGPAFMPPGIMEDDRKRKAIVGLETIAAPQRNLPQDFVAQYAGIMNELPSYFAPMEAEAGTAAGASSSHNNQEGMPIDPVEARKTMNRNRNALYSRRKYALRKIELEVMENQHTRFKAENANLVQEQQRLEALLNAANQCIEGSFGLDGNASPGHEQPSASLQGPSVPKPSEQAHRQTMSQQHPVVHQPSGQDHPTPGSQQRPAQNQPSEQGQPQQQPAQNHPSEQEISPSTLIATVLAKHQKLMREQQQRREQQQQQQQHEHEDASANCQEESRTRTKQPVATAASAATSSSSRVGLDQPIGPVALVPPRLLSNLDSLTPFYPYTDVAPRTASGNAPSRASTLTAHIHAMARFGHNPENTGTGNMFTYPTRGRGRGTGGLLGQWDPSPNLTNISNNGIINNNDTTGFMLDDAPQAIPQRQQLLQLQQQQQQQQQQHPLLGTQLTNATRLQSVAGPMSSIFLTRPYMQVARYAPDVQHTAPLFGNSHLSSSSSDDDDDNDSGERKKPAA